MPQSSKSSPLWRYGLAALLAAGFLTALNALSLHVAPEAAPETRRLEQLDHSVHAVNVGGSIAHGLLFPELAMTGQDLAAGGRDLFENAAMIRAALTRAPEVDRVFLAANPIGMTVDNARLFPRSRQFYYRVLAGTGGGWKPLTGDWGNVVQGRLLPLARADQWRGPWAIFHAWLTGAPAPVRAESMLEADPPPATADDPQRLRSQMGWILALLDSIDRALYFDPTTLARTESALTDLCHDVTARGTSLVIYSPPLSDLYLRQTAAIRAVALPAWSRAISRCQAMGAQVLDFEADPAFLHTYRLFNDPVHLNASGALRFSREMARRLADIDARR